jgi:outer membrane biogenesis lipoprotein LolB
MKKTLGFLVLALSALMTACASSNAASQPKPTQPDSPQWPGDYMAKAAPSELPSRPANATAVQTAQ